MRRIVTGCLTTVAYFFTYILTYLFMLTLVTVVQFVSK